MALRPRRAWLWRKGLEAGPDERAAEQEPRPPIPPGIPTNWLMFGGAVPVRSPHSQDTDALGLVQKDGRGNGKLEQKWKEPL